MGKSNAMTIEEGNEIMAGYMGWKYYPNVKISTWYYDVEAWEPTELKTGNVWVLGATKELDDTQIVSKYYYEMEDKEEPFKEVKYRLAYHEDWNELIPAVKKVLKELELKVTPYIGEGEHAKQQWKLSHTIKDMRQVIHHLEIEPLWEATVKAIQVIKQIEDGQ